MPKTNRRPQPRIFVKTISTLVPLDTYASISEVCYERNINLSTFFRELIDSYFDQQA